MANQPPLFLCSFGGVMMHKLYFKDDGVYLDDLRLQNVTCLKIDSRVHEPTVLDLQILIDVHGLDTAPSAPSQYEFKK